MLLVFAFLCADYLFWTFHRYYLICDICPGGLCRMEPYSRTRPLQRACVVGSYQVPSSTRSHSEILSILLIRHPCSHVVLLRTQIVKLLLMNGADPGGLGIKAPRGSAWWYANVSMNYAKADYFTGYVVYNHTLLSFA